MQCHKGERSQFGVAPLRIQVVDEHKTSSHKPRLAPPMIRRTIFCRPCSHLAYELRLIRQKMSSDLILIFFVCGSVVINHRQVKIGKSSLGEETSSHNLALNFSEMSILGDWMRCRTGNREIGRMGSTGQSSRFLRFLCDVLSNHPVIQHASACRCERSS